MWNKMGLLNPHDFYQSSRKGATQNQEYRNNYREGGKRMYIWDLGLFSELSIYAIDQNEQHKNFEDSVNVWITARHTRIPQQGLWKLNSHCKFNCHWSHSSKKVSQDLWFESNQFDWLVFKSFLRDFYRTQSPTTASIIIMHHKVNTVLELKCRFVNEIEFLKF